MCISPYVCFSNLHLSLLLVKLAIKASGSGLQGALLSRLVAAVCETLPCVPLIHTTTIDLHILPGSFWCVNWVEPTGAVGSGPRALGSIPGRRAQCSAAFTASPCSSGCSRNQGVEVEVELYNYTEVLMLVFLLFFCYIKSCLAQKCSLASKALVALVPLWFNGSYICCESRAKTVSLNRLTLTMLLP